MIAPVDITDVRIETQRMILRPWTMADLEDFYEYASIDGLGQMAGWMPHKTIEESESILRMFIDGKRTFAIEFKENSKVIGSLGIEEPDPDPEETQLGRELGFVLHKAYWGGELALEAVNAIKSWCFGILGYDFLSCSHFDWNTRSRRVIEKCGFRYFSTTRCETLCNTVENSMNYILYNKR